MASSSPFQLQPLQSVPTRAAFGALVAGAIVLTGLVLSPGTIFGALESVTGDPYRFAVVVAALYLVRPALAWPTTPLAVVVGYGYGVALGVPVALAGVVVTVIPVFLAVRWLADGGTDGSVSAVSPTDRGADTGANVDGDGDSDNTDASDERSLLDRTGAVVARYYDTAGPIRGVAASRLAPIPSDVSTAAAAVSGVQLRHLVAGTIAGELPWTIAAVVVGASAATITTGGLGDLGLALSVACALAAVLLLAGPAYRALNGRGSGVAESHSNRSAKTSD
ncbi:TVP38/TMEM64 family protein [Halobiforma nitratireducens]|uniref:TVP38/TMEM64 family protein n=1 Tax=Halobiforma nitratireducens JCM 10879 TaxID=1227454 RepID=M0MQR3_9EURY|nr:VTT domain-containing protein [Halobiforma nitratireducens]EMA47079.1 hypothetical protein C446_00150 [Halobiforma nitratireducens JCM 10879]